MNKNLIFSIICIFLLITIVMIFFLILKPGLIGRIILTGQVIENEKEYSYTKAICNESNFCQDYEIKCKNETLISSTPVTGAIVQHNSDWKDPRENKELCG